MADHVAVQSQFFITYVIVAGVIQIFMRLSQVHNAILYYYLHRTMKDEAMSERRLDQHKKSIKSFHLDEFVPLFLFIFMVGLLYGWIAPIANLFVYIFFIAAFKVFKFMSLYIYSNSYEGGG